MLNSLPCPWCTCSASGRTCRSFKDGAAGVPCPVRWLGAAGVGGEEGADGGLSLCPHGNHPKPANGFHWIWGVESLWLAMDSRPQGSCPIPRSGAPGWVSKAGKLGTGWPGSCQSLQAGAGRPSCKPGVEQRAHPCLNPFCSCGAGCSSRPFPFNCLNWLQVPC